MANTVVKELIEIISEVDNNLFSKNTIILVLSNYLQAEKDQIAEAFNEGRDCEFATNGYKYYEETYLK